jgi:hypothetical protein
MLEFHMWTRTNAVRGGLGLIAVATLVSGCGGSSATTTTTVTQTATVASSATVTVQAPAPVATTQTQAPAPVATAETQAPQAGKIKVPSAVGKDYQSAQDLWRGLGLVVGVAKDATGAHRLPLIDSNWVVVSQDPAAGTEVTEGTVITATVKKFTDG